MHPSILCRYVKPEMIYFREQIVSFAPFVLSLICIFVRHRNVFILSVKAETIFLIGVYLMNINTVISIKGTTYYNASELYRNGSLSNGLSVHFECQPDNPYDSNAVAVMLKTGDMLGYVSKELAPKYTKLIQSGKMSETTISKVKKNGQHIKIYIRVSYERDDDKLQKKYNSRLWKTASALPSKPGVYSIHNIKSEQQYIGSSKNVRQRVLWHIDDLEQNCHPNHVIQSDYLKYGISQFESKVIEVGISPSDLTSRESYHITLLLEKGVALYNLTRDGQGIGYSAKSGSTSEPISDRLWKPPVEVEQTKANGVYNVKRSRSPEVDAMIAENQKREGRKWWWLVVFLIGYMLLNILSD